MHKVLIVEDDSTIARAIQKHLGLWDCQAECVTDFRHVLAAFAAYDPQIVLLDISLPFYNGYYWCSEIRKISKVPILFLSSASDSMNIVMAMQMGGDDFIAKPFDLAVLTAKLQAMLRRSYEFSGLAGLLEHRGAVLNTNDATLTHNGIKVELTKNEYKILQILVESKGKIVHRDELMARLWETDSYIDDNTLTVNVARLRKTLDAVGLPAFITTKKGIGYMVE